MRRLALLTSMAALAACAHAAPPDPLDAFAIRDVHARWSIATVAPELEATDAKPHVEVSLVIDGQVIDARSAASQCRIGDGWLGEPKPLSNVHCSFTGGEANVGAFRDGDVVIVRVQDWQLAGDDQGPPQPHVEEAGRITVSSRGRLVFDAPGPPP